MRARPRTPPRVQACSATLARPQIRARRTPQEILLHKEGPRPPPSVVYGEDVSERGMPCPRHVLADMRIGPRAGQNRARARARAREG